jgi:hypothetical protein
MKFKVIDTVHRRLIIFKQFVEAKEFVDADACADREADQFYKEKSWPRADFTGGVELPATNPRVYLKMDGKLMGWTTCAAFKKFAPAFKKGEVKVNTTYPKSTSIYTEEDFDRDVETITKLYGIDPDLFYSTDEMINMLTLEAKGLDAEAIGDKVVDGDDAKSKGAREIDELKPKAPFAKWYSTKFAAPVGSSKLGNQLR